MKLFILNIVLFSSCILQAFAQRSCATVNDQAVTRVTDLENADFIFAGLFPIKERGCGRYQLERGVERMEAMIRALELINQDSSILNGIKIGYDMRDTCSQETIGIEETVSLIQSEFGSGNLSGIPIGVIGAASSSVSVPVASFLRVFTIPQISYSSTSALLSDTDRYDYFFRTVAPDSFQARAMLDIIRNFGWRFVNAVHTASTYGTPGVEAFIRAVDESNDTCLDVQSQVPVSESMLNTLAGRIVDSRANIVVCFCTTMDASRMLIAVKNYIKSNEIDRTHIVWIASDAWATSVTAISGVESFVNGFFGVSPFSQEFRNFNEYFTNISPYNITNDLWFCGFFREKFDCEYNTTNSSRLCPNSISSSGKEFTQNNIVPFIFDATYALAHALDSVLREKCKFPYNITLQRCENIAGNETVKVGGEVLRDALYRVNFTGITRDFVFFDEFGDGLAKYTINNFVYINETNSVFKEIGVWDSSRSEGSKLSLGGYINPVDNITSYCGGIPPCDPGFKTNFQFDSNRQCCWTCERCLGDTFNPNKFSNSCQICPMGKWGNDPLNRNIKCVIIPITFVNYNIWWNWVFLVLALIGLGGWVIISLIYLGNWNHKVVRASGREHCVLMLIGAGISFPLAFFTIAKPIIFTCVVWTFAYWLSLSLLIFPLLMKIIRIVRIFISKQNIHTRRFISWEWQVVFSLIPVVIVLSIVVISYATKPEVVEQIELIEFTILESPTIQLRCKPAHSAFIIILYAIFILAVIILLFFAILTRTYPKNYRESVHIMYASFALIVVTFANVVIFFILDGGNQIYRPFIQNLCLLLIAYTILLAFFGPRLYYILFGAKGLPDEDAVSSAIGDRTDMSTLDVKKSLAKKHPGIVNPFEKYIKKYDEQKQESLSANQSGEERADYVTEKVDGKSNEKAQVEEKLHVAEADVNNEL